MLFRQIRNATVLLEYAGKRLLIDPWLIPKAAGPAFQAMDPQMQAVHSPLVDLPMRAEELLQHIDAICVTHIHADHFEHASAQMFAGMKASFSAVAGAMAAMESALAAETEYAQAMTQNFGEQKKLLEEQVKDLQQELEYLKPLVANTLAEIASPSSETPADEEAEGKSPLLPEATGDDTADSVFMDVILSSENITKKASETKEAASAQNSWKVGGWFFSAGHSSSSSSASSHKSSAEDTSKIEIGFRAAKVSMERGGWFNPSIFKMSNNFYRLSEMRASGGVNKDMLRKALLLENADTELKKMTTYLPDEQSRDESKRCSYLLPAFPTAFVIAKDITIRVHVSSEEESAEKSYAQAQSNSSGGFFGFSASSGSNSQKSSESAYVGSREQFIYIRIPGPQILGWFQQLVPADMAEDYQSQGNPFSTEDILRMINPHSPLWQENFCGEQSENG